MAERHSDSFDYFDLNVDVTDDGDVKIEFVAVDKGVGRIAMEWDTLREVLDFVGKHGLSMKEPYFVEYAETVEGADKDLLREVLKYAAMAFRYSTALGAIKDNAEAWHGDDAAKGRALAVIAKWAREALYAGA